MDDEQDLAPQPDPSIPNQDEITGRQPSDAHDEPAPSEDSLATDDLLGELDAVQTSLEQAGAAEDDDPPLIDLPHDEARPADSPDLPPLEAPDIADEGRSPFGDELRDVDLATETLSEPVSGEEGGAAAPTSDPVEDLGAKLEDFHAADQGGPDFSGGGGETSSGGSSEDGMSQLGEADIQNRDTVKDFLIGHARRIEAITEFLERSRL